MKLSEYVKKRNGVPMGHSDSLRNNLNRALGARDFATFWNYWNPIFGYYLGKFIFKPLKKILPAGLSLILTFVFCGMIHDIVTTLLRRKPSLFFSVWFLLMSVAVLVSKYNDYNLAGNHWFVRASANLLIVGVCLLLTIGLNTIFGFY